MSLLQLLSFFLLPSVRVSSFIIRKGVKLAKLAYTVAGINAFVYMTAARMIYMLLPEQQVFRIKAASMAKIFVWSEIGAFVVQLVGGGLLANTDSGSTTVALGQKIYMVGIGVQEVIILLFVVLIVRFHRRMVEMTTEGFYKGSQKWRALTWTLYVVLAMITVSRHLPSCFWLDPLYEI